MAKFVVRQSSFAGGEQGEHLYGRKDLSKYLIGARRLENLIPLAHGPVVNRPGSRFIDYTRPVYAAEALHPGDSYYPSQTNIFSKPFLREFEFSDEDTYSLEFGRGYIRFFKDAGAVLEGTALDIHDMTESVTYAGRTLVEASASHGWQHGDCVYILGCTGETSPNGRFWYVRRHEGLPAVITSVADTGAGDNARVITDDAHNYLTGDVVYIDNVVAGADGLIDDKVNDKYHTITVIDGTTFDLDGSDVGGLEAGSGGWCDIVARAEEDAAGPIADDEFYLLDQRMEDIDASAWSYTQDSGTIQRRYELRADRMTDQADVPYQDFPETRLYFAQSADTMIITATTRDFAPRKLVRADHDDWAITTIPWAAIVGTPEPALTDGGMAGAEVTWYVTAISDESLEESSAGVVTSLDPAPADAGGIPIELEWAEVTGAKYYRIYRTDATYRRGGFCGLVDNVVGGGTFNFRTEEDTEAIEPDFTLGPPSENTPFAAGDGSDDCPGVVCLHEQRLIIASTNDAQQQIWLSTRGTYFNLNDSIPLEPGNATNFVMESEKENRIQNLISLRELIVQTSAREFKVYGPGGDLISATAGGIQARPESHEGSGPIQAIPIGTSAVYVSNTGPELRDISFKFEDDGYSGSDLSILARHLLDGYDLVDMGLAKSPWRLFWLVRSDGMLLAHTYNQEHNVWAWSQHPMTNGEVGSLCCTREGRTHGVYLAVTRTIDGNVVECIERMAERDFRNYDMEWDVRNAFFVDCGLTYDDPQPATPVPVDATHKIHAGSGRFIFPEYYEFTADTDWAGGPDWDGDWVDAEGFEGTGGVEEYMNGKRFYVRGSDVGLTYILLAKVEDQENYTEIDASIVSGWTVTRFGTFRKAVTSVPGAHHLEGETVSILANGNVAASQVVTDGVVTLGDDVVRASRIHIGLPMTAELEMLDAETAEGKTSIAYYPQTLEGVAIMARHSRGIRWGPDVDNLVPYRTRPLDQYGKPLPLIEGIIKSQVLPLTGECDHSRLVIRQSDPLPLEIQAVVREIDVKLPPR